MRGADPDGTALDFIVQGGGGFTCIECKWTELPEAADARWLRDVAAMLESAHPLPQYVRRVIAARPASRHQLSDGTYVIHGLDVASEVGARGAT